MAKFDLKEHDKRMREILNRRKAGTAPLSPLPPEALEGLVEVARRKRRGK